MVTAFEAIHACEPVVRVAAFEEALNDALFEQALRPGGTIAPLLSARTKTSKWLSRFPE